jgi:hypothetical protein
VQAIRKVRHRQTGIDGLGVLWGRHDPFFNVDVPRA